MKTGWMPSAPSAAAPAPVQHRMARTATTFRLQAAAPRPAVVRTDAQQKDAATPGALRLPAAEHPAPVVHPGHGKPTTLGAERPHLEEWRARGW